MNSNIVLFALLCGMGHSAHSLDIQEETLPDSLTRHNIDEVVVTGQYEPQSIKNSVYRVRTINRDQIRARASTTVENILNTQLGVRFSNDLALGETDIELIGMSGQNVKVLIDGVPLIDRGATKQSLSQVDVNNIERIEIVEGPMSVTYGTDALAGVINIITRGASLDEQLSISLRLQEESAGNEYNFIRNEGIHNGNLAIDWQRRGWNVMASGSRNNFGGWQGNSTGRTLQWDPKEQWLASSRVGYRNTKTNTWYRLDYLNEDLYSPGAMNLNTGRAVDQNFLTTRFTHLLQSDWQLGHRSSFSGTASFQHYERATQTVRYDFANGTSELTTGAGEQDVALFSSLVLRGTWQYRFSDKVFLQPGVEVLSNRGSGQRMEGDSRITDYAVFVSAEIKPVRWANIRPGLRFIHNTVYDAPPVIPSLNTKFILSDAFDLRSAYARGFRSPALRELYFTFFDSNHSIRGNKNLQAEFSNSFNTYLTWAGTEWGKARISSTVGGFYNDFSNLITIGFDPDDPTVSTYVNIDKFRTAGGTWENTLNIQNLTATLGFSYIGRYNRLSETETDLPSLAWTPEINSNILYNIPKWGAGINIFYKFNGKRPRFEAVTLASGDMSVNRAFIGSFHTADISLNKTITHYLTLSAGVRNLFDVTDVENSTLTGDGAHSSASGTVPMSYGRSFFLGLNVNLQRK